jgi:putative phosphoribosyl transferase
MRAALTAVRRQGPARVVLAVPVAPPEVLAWLAPLVDDEVCPVQPAHMEAVGAWYEDFSQTTDEEVLAYLNAMT